MRVVMATGARPVVVVQWPGHRVSTRPSHAFWLGSAVGSLGLDPPVATSFPRARGLLDRDSLARSGFVAPGGLTPTFCQPFRSSVSAITRHPCTGVPS